MSTLLYLIASSPVSLFTIHSSYTTNLTLQQPPRGLPFFIAPQHNEGSKIFNVSNRVKLLDLSRLRS